MNLSQLEFGSLLTYTPRGNTPLSLQSKDVMKALKRDLFVNMPPILVSEWIAKRVQEKIAELPFGQFFRSNTILVPVPKFFNVANYIMGSRKNRKGLSCCGSWKTG